MEEALRNHLILAAISEHLDYSSLKAIRLANRNWNLASNSELRRRSAIQHFNKRNIHKLYKQEQQLKLLEIRGNTPVSIHVQSGDRRAWRVLKDCRYYRSWRPRITKLQLSDFWTSDLNSLLPLLLTKLRNVKYLILDNMNNSNGPGKSIVPDTDGIVAKTRCDVTFSIQMIRVSFSGKDHTNLDTQFLLKCPHLKELHVEVSKAPSCLSFLEDLRKLGSKGKVLQSCNSVYYQVLIKESEMESRILDLMAGVVNMIEPKILNFSNSRSFNLPPILSSLKPDIKSFTVDIPFSEEPLCYTNWLMQTLRKFKILSSVKKLGLQPMAGKPSPEPVQVEDTDKHNFESVQSLEVSFDGEANVNQRMYFLLIFQAGHYLRNVTKVSLVGIHLNKVWSHGGTQPFGFLQAIHWFANLQVLKLELIDNFRDLMKVGKGIERKERRGLLQPLSLRTGKQTRLIEIDCKMNYNITMDSILLALFSGYEPQCGLRMNVKTKSGRTVRKFNVEEFKNSIEGAKPYFGCDDNDKCEILFGVILCSAVLLYLLSSMFNFISDCCVNLYGIMWEVFLNGGIA